MNFYKQSHPNKTPPHKAIYPCVVLISDNWNDYGYYTSWGIAIYTSDSADPIEGAIKILERDPANPREALTITSLPEPFISLDENYCSLLQSMTIYEKLFQAGPTIYNPILRALRDVATLPESTQVFQEMYGFKKSLLRFSEAEKAFKEAAYIFQGRSAIQSLRFTYKCIVPGAITPHEVEFDFSPHPTGLNRIIVIIGKNGTGKTQFLANIANSLSGLSEATDQNHGFTPTRPTFSRVIAVSYSVFDTFTRPNSNTGKDRTFSYKYCGIRSPIKINNSEGAQFLSETELLVKLSEAKQTIHKENRTQVWLNILSILLENQFADEQTEVESLNFYTKLSSGQKILVAVMTDIIANIQKQSVILFDEPEIHLHPEALAALARAIDQLLTDFDSYSIIATHSSLLLQETLSRQVRIFRRIGSSPHISPLTVESFGENLSAITREVFAVDGEKNNFRAILERLAHDQTPEDVENLFPLGLPILAQTYLQAIQRKAK